MTPDDHDLTLQGLQRLAVLDPDPARSDRVRARCRAAVGQHGRQPASRKHLTGRALESGLTYALSAGYVAAMIHDLLSVYMRR